MRARARACVRARERARVLFCCWRARCTTSQECNKYAVAAAAVASARRCLKLLFRVASRAVVMSSKCSLKSLGFVSQWCFDGDKVKQYEHECAHCPDSPTVKLDGVTLCRRHYQEHMYGNEHRPVTAPWFAAARRANPPSNCYWQGEAHR